jgi:hypothetical protein
MEMTAATTVMTAAMTVVTMAATNKSKPTTLH